MERDCCLHGREEDAASAATTTSHFDIRWFGNVSLYVVSCFGLRHAWWVVRRLDIDEREVVEAAPMVVVVVVRAACGPKFRWRFVNPASANQSSRPYVDEVQQ